jgi:hypothetical protein
MHKNLRHCQKFQGIVDRHSKKIFLDQASTVLQNLHYLYLDGRVHYLIVG